MNVLGDDISFDVIFCDLDFKAYFSAIFNKGFWFGLKILLQSGKIQLRVIEEVEK